MAEWNHTPETLPLGTNPLWSWPPRPSAVLRWYWQGWFPISVNLAIAALAVLCYTFAAPSLETASSPDLWILGLWLRNALIVTALAQGLHWVFHARQMQGTAHKYDPRPYPRNGRMFSFASQYRDNVFWTLASGVTVWTLLEALVLWSMANGYASVWMWSDGWLWFLAFFFLVPVWESFYFYWIHRLLHTRPFYRFHALHHRNTDVGPWSGLSMHPVEHLLYFGTVFIHFLVPTHPVHLIFHLMFYGLYAISTHTGFEGLWAGGKKRLQLGMFHHQMHHRYFEVNYGTLEVPWDRFFGTFHDGTEAGKEMMKTRLKNRPKP